MKKRNSILLSSAGCLTFLFILFQNFTYQSQSLTCTDDSKPQQIKITTPGDYKLNPANGKTCYTSIEITSSNVTLDCQNVALWGIPHEKYEINDEGKRVLASDYSRDHLKSSLMFKDIFKETKDSSDSETKERLKKLYSPLRVGINVNGPVSSQIKDIIVRNCNLYAYRRAIGIESEKHAANWFWEDLLNNPLRNSALDMREQIKTMILHPSWKTPFRELRSLPWDDVLPSQIRKMAPTKVTFENITIKDTAISAIYVDHHVTKTSLKGVQVENAGGVGVYFEFGSRDNVVTSLGSRMSMFVNTNREGIAIDSSSRNLIENTHFSENAQGGIFLYRNCWEYFRDPQLTVSTEIFEKIKKEKIKSASFDPEGDLVVNFENGDYGKLKAGRTNYFPRTQGSDSNIIRKNTFSGKGTEQTGVGVWVASRQSTLIDFGNLEYKDGLGCGLYPMQSETDGPRKYHMDRAQNNIIYGNTFERIRKGIIVEDNGNRIFGNLFKDTVVEPISIGTSIRPTAPNILKGEVRKSRVAFNLFNSSKELSELAKLKFGSENAEDFSESTNNYIPSNVNCSNYGSSGTEDSGHVLKGRRCTDDYLEIIRESLYPYFDSQVQELMKADYPVLR